MIFCNKNFSTRTFLIACSLALFSSLLVSYADEPVQKPNATPTLLLETYFPSLYFHGDSEEARVFGITSSNSSFYDQTFYNTLKAQSADSKTEERAFVLFGKTAKCNSRLVEDFRNEADAHYPPPFCGFVGLDYLRDTDLYLNSTENQIFFGSLAELVLKDKKFSLKEMERIEVRYDRFNSRSIPAIKVGLPSGEYISCDLALIETTSVGLTSEHFNAFLKSGQMKLLPRPKEKGQLSNSRFGRLDHIQIGPFQLRNIICAETLSNEIGLGVLHRFEVALSLKDKMLALKLLHDIPWDHSDYDGIFLDRDEQSGKPIVEEVFKDSIAEDAGLLPGDILTGVDGFAGVLSTGKFQKIVVLRNKAITLQVLREGKPIDIVLKSEL